MSQKKDTTVTIIALLVTGGIAFGGYWWLTKGANSFSKVVNTSSDKTPIGSVPSQSLDLPKADKFTDISSIPKGSFRYGGSTTWAPIRAIVYSEIEKALPDFQLQYNDPSSNSGLTPSSGAGIRMLLNNELAFSQSSRALKDTEKQEAQQKGFSLQEIPVGTDGIVVAVNPKLKVTGLTIDQLKGIYTGQITNWKQIDGSDLKITPYSRAGEGGTVDFFVKEVLKAELGANVQFAVTTTDGLRKVAKDSGGIYYASAPEIIGQCIVKPLALGLTPDKLITPYQPPLKSSNCPPYRNQLNTEVFHNGQYPITRPLFVIVKKNGGTEEQVGKAYANLLLTKQGQDLIEKAGFVGLSK